MKRSLLVSILLMIAIATAACQGVNRGTEAENPGALDANEAVPVKVVVGDIEIHLPDGWTIDEQDDTMAQLSPIQSCRLSVP